MLVLPIESRTLLVLMAPVAQFKDKDKQEPATDRGTGAPLVEVSVALTDGGGPQVLRVSVPQPGVPKDLGVGSLVSPTGLTLIAGEKNGRAWQIFRASALTAVKSG
ncbi:MAG TPA: hypothetical protein VFW21_13895 [Mycobacterium sp.]|nr:hypothetical protein [Mycobacterium sp.]